jgi:hypothetical protein
MPAPSMCHPRTFSTGCTVRATAASTFIARAFPSGGSAPSPSRPRVSGLTGTLAPPSAASTPSRAFRLLVDGEKGLVRADSRIRVTSGSNRLPRDPQSPYIDGRTLKWLKVIGCAGGME